MKTIHTAAKNFCEKHGHRFTPPRESVLGIVAKSKEPLGAYDILRKMGTDTKPPTVYRAIEFWQKHGFIHRIESQNTYTACPSGRPHHNHQFFICDSCGTTQETQLCQLPLDIWKKADEENFTVSNWNLEIHGTCQTCQAS